MSRRASVVCYFSVTHRFDFLEDAYKIVASQLGDVPLWPFIRLKQSGKKMRIFGYILEAFGHTASTRKNNTFRSA